MSRPRQYSPEFVQEALRLLRDSGKSRRKIAGDLGVCPETLHKWEMAYRDDGSKRSASETATQAEIERLKRELWLANEEREILKKVRHALLGTTKDENPRYRSTFLQPDI